jgi:aqualysin 1
MKNRLLVGSLAMVLAGCGDQFAGAPTPGGEAVLAQPQVRGAMIAAIPSRYIVVFHSHVRNPRQRAADMAAAAGAQVHFVYGSAIRGFSATIPDAALQRVLSDPDVAWVERDQEVSLSGGDGADTQEGAIWGLDRIDQRGTSLDRKYTYDANGAGVRAYVIDTGIRRTHVDFGNRVTLDGFTAINDSRGTDDCNGHGTHVAGTIGGALHGVAKAVTLVPVRVLNCRGSGTWSGVIAGIDWVASEKQKESLKDVPMVANLSLGGAASSTVDAALSKTIDMGVTVAVAAGNSGADACNYSPARVKEALTVGATDAGDQRASWSNFGRCVDVFAPGVSITSAWHRNDSSTNTISGTSMAAPHVAGVAALILGGDPAASPAAVVTALLGRASPEMVGGSNGSSNLLLFSLDRPFVPPQGELVEDASDEEGETIGGGGGGNHSDATRLAIGSLKGSVSPGRNNWKAVVEVTVTVNDQPLDGVSVTGTFSIGGNGKCETGIGGNGTGTCSMSSGALQNGIASTQFRIDSISAGGYEDSLAGPRCVRIDKDGNNGDCQ